MKRNIVAIICVMLAATFIFASCTKKNNIYIDNKGESHIAYTNSNGETVTDGIGGVIIVHTDKYGFPKKDSNGETITELFQTGITIDSKGKKIDAPTYSLKIPGDWIVLDEFTDYARLRLGDKKSNTSMDIQPSRTSVESALSSMKNLYDDLSENAEKVFEIKEEKVTLDNPSINEATKFSFSASHTTEDGTIFIELYSYVFSMDKATYIITCGTKGEKEDDLGKTDYEEVINAIEFK